MIVLPLTRTFYIFVTRSRIVMYLKYIMLLVSLCCAIVTANPNVVNVAREKKYTQISTYSVQGWSSNAANGNTSGDFTSINCIHTDARDNLPYPRTPYHWWEVDLGEVYPVHNITVWSRDNWIVRLYPFTITVDGQTCVSVTSIPSFVIRNNSVTCSSVMYGQVVRLTLTTTEYFLNLCEFQIFVCREGFYGLDCSSRCDTKCEGGCNRTSGHCTRCKDGFYGKDCSSECDTNCTGGCNVTSGYCTGCKAGAYGPYFCREMCPAKCAGGTCQRDNGDCNNCVAGFFGSKCTCHPNCEGGCNSASGMCTRCQPGYHGDQCTSPCSSLGSRCTQCSQNGTCTACSGHFMTPACTACREGWYGNLCNIQCSSGCARCDQTSGTCEACTRNSHLVLPGCTECEDRYYKQTASSCIQCPGTCDNNTPCDKTTGHCQQCPPGTKGDTCNQACDGGQYGPSRCSLSCGQCQNHQQCNLVTGHCPLCAPGFYPPLCSKTNQDTDKDSVVVPVVGSVIGAAVIVAIGVVAAVCWYRRSRRGPAAERGNRATVRERGSSQGNKATASSVNHPPSSPIQEDDAIYEISDTACTHEMHTVENDYDKCHIYFNNDADRQPYAQITPHSSGVTKSPANDDYVNIAFA